MSSKEQPVINDIQALQTARVNTTSALSASRRVSVGQLKIIARLVGRLRSGPRLVADNADVVPANRVDWPSWPADRADVVFSLPTPITNTDNAHEKYNLSVLLNCCGIYFFIY